METMGGVIAALATDVGRVRAHNEDAGLITSDLVAVADGMGGHAAGEVASGLAVEALRAVGESAGSGEAAAAAQGRARRGPGGEPRDPAVGRAEPRADRDGHDAGRAGAGDGGRFAALGGGQHRRLAGLPGRRRAAHPGQHGPLRGRRAGVPRAADAAGGAGPPGAQHRDPLPGPRPAGAGGLVGVPAARGGAVPALHGRADQRAARPGDRPDPARRRRPAGDRRPAWWRPRSRPAVATT